MRCRQVEAGGSVVSLFMLSAGKTGLFFVAAWRLHGTTAYPAFKA
jgi:hypothetical protein